MDHMLNFLLYLLTIGCIVGLGAIVYAYVTRNKR